jgi:hypothetical protein
MSVTKYEDIVLEITGKIGIIKVHLLANLAEQDF